MERILIGFVGASRVGKDTFAAALRKKLLAANQPAFIKKFGNAVKFVAREECQRIHGIDSFTEQNEEKEIIRPILEKVGTQIRQKNPKYLVDVIKASLTDKGVVIFADLRDSVEAKFIHQQNGILFKLSRNGVIPRPIEVPFLESVHCDYSFEVDNYDATYNQKMLDFCVSKIEQQYPLQPLLCT